MKRKLLGYVVAFAVMLTSMLPIILLHADAVTVAGMDPSIGKPGHMVNIHGVGFQSCDPISVTFGPVENLSVRPNNDKLIKFYVPSVDPGVYGVRVNCGGDSMFAGEFTVQ